MDNHSLQEVKDILRSKKFMKFFVGDTENTLIQFFRYLFVGGLATVVDWGISYLLFRFAFNEHYAVAANAISFVAGLAVNYLISTFWIFKNSRGKIKTYGISWLCGDRSCGTVYDNGHNKAL